MTWSKIKSRMIALLASSLRGRVDYFSTHYRDGGDWDGRGWLTVDGEEILNMPHFYECQAGVARGPVQTTLLV